MTKYYQFKALWQTTGWIPNACVGVDDNGVINYLSDRVPDHPVALEYVNGYALPGFQNAHSHAFQYGMAGMAEKHEPGARDDFWSWREAMYLCALSMSPDQMEAVAAMLYAEMLRFGYTHVAEFHYVHHDTDGKPYRNLAETGERLVAAAETAGIKITLIPIFYQKGGFGKDPQPRQRRFISHDTDQYFALLDASRGAVKNSALARLGFGVHSLRAVNPSDIKQTFRQGPSDLPFHLHAAEQLKEIDDCVDYLKQRPIEWLLNELPLNERFHIVHCTHMTDVEVNGLAKSGAHAVLCPGTEGNLGDGIFRLTDFYKAGGSWSIGTDSHISLNPLEDLRWLDYAQRFTTHRRNTFDDGARVLVNTTAVAGRKAMGVSESFLTMGQPLDAIVYRAETPLLQQAGVHHALPALIYTTDSAAAYGTLVNGQWVVRNQDHIRRKTIEEKFSATIRQLQHQS
jgi:formimidoylglutamate deiminase